MADLESTPGGTVAGSAMEIRESFRGIQHGRQEARVEVPQFVLELPSTLANEPFATSFRYLFCT